MFGYSLFRLSLFIALAIIACTASGLFTYLVVSALAETDSRIRVINNTTNLGKVRISGEILLG